MIFFINSCATNNIKKVPKTNNIEKSWENYKKSLLEIKSWQTSGVIGVRSSNNMESANFTWFQYNENKFSLSFYGTFGIGEVKLEKDNNIVQLIKSKDEIITADNLQDLMLKTLKWYVPTDGFYYWARALNNPYKISKTILNEDGLLGKLIQDNWIITYKNYKIWDNKYPLPGKVIMKNQNLTIIMAFEEWKINL